MRVLLTRAAEDAARTRATLEALGHEVLVSPVIVIEATGAAWPGGAIDAILATSGQAFVAVPAGWGPTAEVRRLAPLWLVGQRTEQAARAAGFLGSTHVSPNAVSLAFEISKHRQRSRIIYLAGRDRKPDIETALNVMDQAIEIIEIYEARATSQIEDRAMNALSAGTIDAVLHFSRRSVELFVDLVGRDRLTSRAMHVCLSEDVAFPLAGCDLPVRISAEPNEVALIAALESA